MVFKIPTIHLLVFLYFQFFKDHFLFRRINFGCSQPLLNRCFVALFCDWDIKKPKLRGVICVLAAFWHQKETGVSVCVCVCVLRARARKMELYYFDLTFCSSFLSQSPNFLHTLGCSADYLRHADTMLHSLTKKLKTGMQHHDYESVIQRKSACQLGFGNTAHG